MGNICRTPADIEAEIRHDILQEELKLSQYDLKFDGRHPPMGYRYKVYKFTGTAPTRYVGYVYMPFDAEMTVSNIVRKFLDEKAAEEELNKRDDD